MTPWRPLVAPPAPQQARALNVVLFSGGRGSSALTERLLADRRVSLTLAINGYDDGASTGAVRRFLGDALGPSDFRKNAARVARILTTAPAALIELLDLRLPESTTAADVATFAAGLADITGAAATLADAGSLPLDGFWTQAMRLAARVGDAQRSTAAAALVRFDVERQRLGRAFAFGDCAIGNLVFGGLFLLESRRFNATVDAYARLLGIAPGLIENVSDGADAHLVALDREGALLGSEAAIVDARRHNRIAEIFLLREAPTEADLREAAHRGPDDLQAWLRDRTCDVALSGRLAARLAEADLIVYAPGTQHSSLFPSYLTAGLGEAIAGNVRAVKLLVTNLQADAEIHEASAVDILDRALHYLTRRGRTRLPSPCVITHCLINRPDPRGAIAPDAAPYVAPGALDRVDDPRMVWVSNFEAGASGRHDAGKVLDPFLEALFARQHRPRVALLLQGTTAATRIVQTALELTRAGAGEASVDLVVFHACGEPTVGELAARLPFRIEPLCGENVDTAFAAAAAAMDADYVGMFDSSGMYNGEDLVGLLAQLSIGRPGAVWGSRRLSVRDVHESYRVRYRHHLLLGVASYVGSHVLSLMYLLCYGRYVSDTLSEARFVVRGYLDACAATVGDRQINHALLSSVLADRAELRELPVRFLPLSPARARRTGIADGLAALATIARLRLARVWRAGAPGRPQTHTVAAGLAGRPL